MKLFMKCYSNPIFLDRCAFAAFLKHPRMGDIQISDVK